MLLEYQPDIVIITGHDEKKKKKGDIHDIRNYKNTENFIRAVREARKFEKSHEKLVIIAGACQSNYEELIKAGANFASSPKRVNIHALDPAIIAVTIATSERNKQIDLVNLLDKTKYGKDGMGGLMCNGLMYVGYPRQKRGVFMNIEIIKDHMRPHLNEKVEVSVYGLRNKTEYFIGTLSKMYPYIFTILVNETEKSFNYADIITGEVEVKYL